VPRFAYVASKASNRVYGYTIDAATGALMENSSVPACRGPVALTANRTGRWLYVVCGDSFEVWVFTVGATGQLALLQTMPVYGDPEAGAIAPSDCCLYVTKNLAGAGPLTTSFTLQRYTINATTGELAFAEEQRTQGANPDAVAVSPQGDYVFVANFSGGASSTYAGGNVMTFRANPSTGAMTPVGLVQTGVAPVSLEVDPSGTWPSWPIAPEMAWPYTRSITSRGT
jgi:6-phosphogluconolactonase (cycloisomerase 2 family)